MTDADILLLALNARYAHTSLGMRSLRANLGRLRERSRLLEFDLQADRARVAEEILSRPPRVLALGIYIWNTDFAKHLLPQIRHRAPHTRILLGGPELIRDADPIWADLADGQIPGEGEPAFARMCEALRDGERAPEQGRPEPADPARLILPDAEYSDTDLATRVTYAETSRGCPFRCDYCLSAGDSPVRYFPEDRVFESLDRLVLRGAKRFKFVDRTFNADPDRAARQLDFWLQRSRPGLSVQYEAVPEKFPSVLRDRLRRFPPNSLRLEIGIQTLDPDVSRRIGRPLQADRVEETFTFLRDETKVGVHADLIAGLPGEDLAGFARGFNRVIAWTPVELQVGLLKRLRGTTLARHDEPFGMRYAPAPPYELQSHRTLSASDVDRLKRFARYWDRTYNRGALRTLLPELWADSGCAFEEFMRFSDWAHERLGRDWGISLNRLGETLADFQKEIRGNADAAERIRNALQCRNELARRGAPPGHHDA